MLNITLIREFQLVKELNFKKEEFLTFSVALKKYITIDFKIKVSINEIFSIILTFYSYGKIMN